MKRRKKSWEIILAGLLLTVLGIYLLVPAQTDYRYNIDEASFSVPELPSVKGKNDIPDSISITLQKLEKLKILENFKDVENIEQFKSELKNLKEMEELKHFEEELQELEKELQKHEE